jgi:CHAT domain-containing protein
MKTANRLKVRLSVLAGWLALVVAMSPGLVLVHSQSAEESEIRLVVQKFLTALQKKDSATLASLSSEKAKDSASSQTPSQAAAAAFGNVDLNTLTIKQVSIGAAEATAWVSVKSSTTSPRDSKPDQKPQQTNLTIHLVKETGAWKVQSHRSSEEELADAIAAAGSDEERKTLIDGHADLITAQLGRALIVICGRLMSQSNYPQALGLLQIAGQITDQVKDRANRAAVSRGIGMIRYRQGDYQAATERFEESLRGYEDAGRKEGVAAVLNDLGLIHRNKGDNAEALKCYNRSLEINQELGDKRGISQELTNIGYVLEAQGDYSQALENYEKSLKISESIGDRYLTAVTLSAIANVHYFRANYLEALSSYQKALGAFTELGARLEMAGALLGIGNVLNNQGDYPDAIKEYQKSLEIEELLRDKPGIAKDLVCIANVQFYQGNYSPALQYYDRAFRIDEEMGLRRDAATVLGNIGALHGAEGNSAQALKYFAQALTLAREIGDRQLIASFLINIAELHKLSGNFADARKSYEDALRVAEEIETGESIAEALEGLGTIELAAANSEPALAYLQRSLALNEQSGNKRRVALTLGQLGQVYASKGQYLQAIELHERAATIARQIRTPDELVSILTPAADAYRASGKLDQARKALLEAIETVEQLRGLVAGSEQERQSFLEQQVAPYYAMAALLIDQNTYFEALTFAERAKARTLIDVLESGKANLTKALTSEEIDREQKLNAHLVSLNAQIITQKIVKVPDEKRVADLTAQLEQARLEYGAFHTGLYAAHPELRVQRAEFQPISLAECTAFVPDQNTALLEFAVSDHHTYLFVLTRKNPSQALPDLKAYKIDVKSKDLSDLCRRFHEQLSQHGLDFDSLARKLYALLLGPAAAELQARTNLVIVPDGPLWDLPFQALKPNSQHYMIESHAVSYAPSLTALREMYKRSSFSLAAAGRSEALLALGNPALSAQTSSEIKEVFMDADLAALPRAEAQVRELAKIYGSAQSKVYTGAEATEDRFKSDAPGARVLHIAAHGIVNNASPMYSQLVLSRSPGSQDDGVLEAWEIMNMDLKADLVVLAACDTAGGRYGAGEGMIGLSWAFFIAGCPTTVVSQWSVEAESTSRLMIDFHRNLRSGLAKAEALRRAELKLLRGDQRYRDPFYWAPFVVIGAAN